MAVARALQQLKQLNDVLQHQRWPGLFKVVCDLRTALTEGWPAGGRSQPGGTPAEHAELARLTVAVAERLVHAEAAGTLLPLGSLWVACAASAAASCAMLASHRSLGPADSASVMAVAAIALGSGRSVLQGVALLSRAALPEAVGMVADILDNMQYCMMLSANTGLLDAFARQVALPSRLLSWLHDAAAVLIRMGRLSRAARRPAQLPAADAGPLVSHLTSYACVLALTLPVVQTLDSGSLGAMADPRLTHPLLLALSQALPALRGECNPLHTREVWQLLLYVGVILQIKSQHSSDAARRILLNSSTRLAGPVLTELVRDVAAALPASSPADVPTETFAAVCIGLCHALTLLPPPGSESSSESLEDDLALSPGDWAAVEVFSMFSPTICRAAMPPRQLPSYLLLEAGQALFGAAIRVAPLLQRAPGSCSPQQLQLVFDVAWQSARQLPLLVAAAAVTGTAPSEEERGKWGVASLTLLESLVTAALQLAVPARSSAASSGQAGSQQEAAAGAALATQLLQRTHVGLCKMAHFLVGTVPAEQHGVQAALAAANPSLACLLAQCFYALQLAYARSGSSGRQPSEEEVTGQGHVSPTRQLQLTHAALQWEAVQALAGCRGALLPQAASVASGFRQDAPSEVAVLYQSFVHLLACSPGALRGSPWLQLIMPVFVRHFKKLHEIAPQLAEEDEMSPFQNLSSIFPGMERQEVLREAEVDILAFALQRLAADGGLAAEFLSHPRLPALLSQAAGTPASDKKFGALVEQLSAALHSMLGAAAAVEAAGSSQGGSGGSQSAQAPAEQLAELAAAAASLEAAMAAASLPAPPPCPDRAAFPFVLPTWVAAHGLLFQGRGGSSSAGGAGQVETAASSSPAPKASLAAFQQTLLTCVKRLAAALLPLWPPLGQQQAERLELARAVAAYTSGCSNLRCPDWQGQCKKALRCSGCKKVRFCNAACQADSWRHGGHKYVCKLLAAAAADQA